MMTCCHALVCEAQVLACCCAVEKISAQAAEQPHPALGSTSGVGMLQEEGQALQVFGAFTLPRGMDGSFMCFS